MALQRTELCIFNFEYIFGSNTHLLQIKVYYFEADRGTRNRPEKSGIKLVHVLH
jgi:hypothetical protein